MISQNKTISAETAAQSTLPKGFLQKYKIIASDPCSWKINSFEQIGIHDPFPLENPSDQQDMPENFQSVRESSQEEVYDSDRMNSQFGSPAMIYIPRKELMIKMMRACIAVSEIG